MDIREILEALYEIQISLDADDITCWKSPECPYCMINKLRLDIEKDTSAGN